jgi:hypothetical protein
MLNRSRILSLAAVATIGTAALAAPSASAKPAPIGVVHSFSPVHLGNPVRVNPGALHALKPGNGGPSIHLNPGVLHLANPGSPPSLPPAINFKKPIDIDCVTFKGCDHDHDHDHDHDWDHDHDHDHDWDHDHHRPWVFWWHRPHYGVEYDTVTAPVETATAPAPCNCLTKQYLQDGTVLFTDLCTKEEAMATPDELRAQAQATPPKAQ